jgi:hypothetical protein
MQRQVDNSGMVVPQTFSHSGHAVHVRATQPVTT